MALLDRRGRNTLACQEYSRLVFIKSLSMKKNGYVFVGRRK